MLRSSSMPEQAPVSNAGVTCVAVDVAHDAIPGLTDLCVFVLPGACAVQRQVAGQWIDMQVLYRGGIVVTRLTGPFRVVGSRQPEGFALGIDRAMAAQPFDVLGERLLGTPVLQIEVDSVINSLVNVLALAARASAPCVREPLIEAIALRLSVISRREPVESTTRQVPLPAWRLRRVTDLVSQRLDAGISLADMARAAGLSPMHFAAQFKAATGMRPHHYLLAQRIDRAKHLLEKTEDTIMDIAIAVGFQTQGHFATVFKQHESLTPRQWRGTRSSRAQTAHRVRASTQARLAAGPGRA